MIDALFWVAVGTAIGWHFPQPSWAATILTQLKNLFSKA
jgi:hypothetical protein